MLPPLWTINSSTNYFPWYSGGALPIFLTSKDLLYNPISVLSPYVLGKIIIPPKWTPKASGRGFFCLYFVYDE